ncbi:MAG: hypothetical protein LBH35_05675 [Treponema sp.]|jgi:hypothetical protein|nr:hypothetical protein [Treponema sp.]
MRLLLLFFAALCFSLSCVREAPPQNGSAAAAEAEVEDGPRTAAIVRIGAEPFWFELAAGGPRPVPSPRHAALEPFAPWKLSRHITAFLADESRLAAAVNQEGFLVFEFPKDGEIAFQYYPDSGWDGYTVSSVFWDGRFPAALLARDGIFSDSLSPPPDPALRRFDGNVISGFEAAAFAALSPEDGWETLNILWDGAWYCRKLRRGAEAVEEAYLKAADLAGAGERSSGGAFLRAARPKDPAEAPRSPAGPLLGAALEAAGALAGKPCVFRTVSPEFTAAGVFQTGTGGDTTEILDASAYYRPGAALALLPDGRGVFHGESRSGGFALPSLPEGYVYTAICLAGENNGKYTLIVSWEEQENWNVGAAGFGMLEIGL